MAEKYYGVTPYGYCGCEPIRFVDYDGLSRKVSIDHKSKSITISATFLYTDKRLKSGINNAKSLLNSQQGLEYEIDGASYSVNFDVSTKFCSSKDDFNVYIVMGGWETKSVLLIIWGLKKEEKS